MVPAGLFLSVDGYARRFGLGATGGLSAPAGTGSKLPVAPVAPR